MDFSVTDKLKTKLQYIKKHDQKLEKLLRKKLELFKQNEKHPSLRTHQLKGNLKNVWSISITMQIRMVYTIKESRAYFFNIGTHDEVYTD